MSSRDFSTYFGCVFFVPAMTKLFFFCAGLEFFRRLNVRISSSKLTWFRVFFPARRRNQTNPKTKLPPRQSTYLVGPGNLSLSTACPIPKLLGSNKNPRIKALELLPLFPGPPRGLPSVCSIADIIAALRSGLQAVPHRNRDPVPSADPHAP